MKRRVREFTVAKTTNNEELMMATMGHARMAAAVAMRSPTRRGGDAGSERSRPFPTKTKPLARHEIHDGPIDEIGLDDCGEPSEHHRRCEPKLLCGLDA